MSTWKKALLLQLWFFIGFPLLGALLIRLLGPLGVLILLVLFVVWCWELFAYFHYRHCRQEEFLQVLQTAAATQAPVESVLRYGANLSQFKSGMFAAGDGRRAAATWNN